MFRVLFVHNREYNNCIKRLIDANYLFYTIILLPDYRPARPQHVGVNGFIIVFESNKICVFVVLNYSSLNVFHGMENKKFTFL